MSFTSTWISFNLWLSTILASVRRVGLCTEVCTRAFYGFLPVDVNPPETTFLSLFLFLKDISLFLPQCFCILFSDFCMSNIFLFSVPSFNISLGKAFWMPCLKLPPHTLHYMALFWLLHHTNRSWKSTCGWRSYGTYIQWNITHIKRNDTGWFPERRMNLEFVTQSKVRKRRPSIVYQCIYVKTRKMVQTNLLAGQ